MTTDVKRELSRRHRPPGRLRLRQLRGDAVLSSIGELTLLCAPVPEQRSRINDLLAVMAAPVDGQHLGRSVAALIGAAEPGTYPPLCAFGPVRDGIAAVVHGAAEMVLTLAGRQVRLDRQRPGSVINRVVADPVKSIRATINVAGSYLGAEWTVGPAAAEPAEASLSAPRVADDRVVGVCCDKGHFNDPEVAYCATCGISTVHAGPPRLGTRPQLGVLVLDDGTVLPLVGEQVIGSRPGNDPAVAAGRASPVTFADPQVAAVHARIVLDGWDVTVVAETTGTFIRRPQAHGWSPLPTGVAIRLPAGTVLACGRRQLHYHSFRSLLGERSW